jgi:NAD(P)-dependent dehydrogenase (short-subunit alcohol dehydrogenase family)
LDVLVQSAGGPAPGGIDVVTEENWMDAFAVHVHSNFHLAKAAAPHMAAQNGGAIIMLGSAAGLRGCLGALAYGVVKGVLPQFARALARELGELRLSRCHSNSIPKLPYARAGYE